MKKLETIIISPIGDIPSWISKNVARSITDLFGFETRIQVVLDDITFAFDEKRNQYCSTPILERLETLTPDDALKLLAITQEDLFIPILTHVYGEAQLGGKTSIVSILRLLTSPDAWDLKSGCERLVKEAAHELGHTFDLRHCQDPDCMMHYCRKLEDVDQKSEKFCRYCSVMLNDAIQGPAR